MIDRVAFTILGKEVYWYGIIIALATLIGMYLAMAEAKRRGEKPDDLVDFLLLALPLAIVFGRLYYVAFEWPQFAAEPVNPRNAASASCIVNRRMSSRPVIISHVPICFSMNYTSFRADWNRVNV